MTTSEFSLERENLILKNCHANEELCGYRQRQRRMLAGKERERMRAKDASQ